ncbi:WYL domain-containing protein [Paenibacillus sp. FSL K6-0276]|uniref:WYL domain-containing protein n=1 Tax=Paenibacillus sp. FSL K6-0276 TaxID=2921450 RepID=UPI0030EDFE64
MYASNGLWYCPAYRFLRRDIRIFRCDRIHSAVYSTSETKPINLQHVHLGNRESIVKVEQEYVSLNVELSIEGVQSCEDELWSVPKLHIRNDGTGWLDGDISKGDVHFLQSFSLA